MKELLPTNLKSALQPTDDPQGLEQNFFAYVLHHALSITHAREGGVLSIAENGASLRIEKFEPKNVDQVSLILPLTDPPQSISARCALSGRPERVDDVKSDPLFQPKSDSDIRSQLTVPVQHGEKKLGVVNLESEEPRHFTDDHRDAVVEFTAEIAPIWNLVSSMSREARYRELVESFRVLLQALLLDDPRETLKILLDQALRLTGSTLGGVCLLTNDRNAIRVDPAKGLSGAAGEVPEIPAGKGVVWACVTNREARNIPDVRECLEYYDLTEGTIRSLLCVPMLTEDGKCVGALNIESNQLNHFSLLDEEMMTLLAREGAIAVKTMRNKKRFAAADSLAALGSVSGNITHRINNYAGGILVLSKMLKQKLASQPQEQEWAGLIHQAAFDALRTVEHFENQVSMEEEAVDLSAFLRQIEPKLLELHQLPIKLVLCDPSPIITVSRDALSEILQELVGNVKKAGRADLVEISCTLGNGYILLSVFDNGVTIPKEQAVRIFERGNSLSKTGVGTGYGLWWIDRYMSKLGGSVDHQPGSLKESQSGLLRGNYFRLLFPAPSMNLESSE